MDEAAVREFIGTDYPRVVAAMALVSGSRPAAEDAVQEALARAWERSQQGQRIENLRAWVTTVALNLVRSRFRRLAAERRATERLGGRLLGAGAAGGGSDVAVDVARALARLPRRQREATVLRYYLDMDVREVARTLGLQEGTAKTTLHRARRALAVALGERDVQEREEAIDGAGC